MKLEFYEQIFEKSSNIKFHENPSGGSGDVPCGRTDGQTDLTDMTKLIITFRNFEKTPKKRHCPRVSIKNYCCFDKTNVLLT